MTGKKYEPLDETHKQVTLEQEGPPRPTQHPADNRVTAGPPSEGPLREPEPATEEERRARLEKVIEILKANKLIEPHEIGRKWVDFEARERDRALAEEARKRQAGGDAPRTTEPPRADSPTPPKKEDKHIEDKFANVEMTEAQRARRDKMEELGFRDAGNEIVRGNPGRTRR